MKSDMEEQTTQPTPEDEPGQAVPEPPAPEQPAAEEVVAEQPVAAPAPVAEQPPAPAEEAPAPAAEEPPAPAEEAPAPAAEEPPAPAPVEEPPTAVEEQPTPAPAEEQAAPAAEAEASPPATGEAKPSLGKIKKLQESQARRPRRRRKPGQQGEGQPQGEGRPQGERPRRPKPPRQPRQQREKGPLPFPELRAAAQSIMDVHGSRKALREAFAELAPKERQQLAELVAGDGDFRVRARSISAGSLAAGKLGKALAAQQVAIADVEDLWPLALSKEEAAERLAYIRNAQRRDEQRAKRNEERNKRSDRVSREDLAKAQDGRVGAQIRIVIAGEKDRDRGKKPTDEPKKKPSGSDLLDRLGY